MTQTSPSDLVSLAGRNLYFRLPAGNMPSRLPSARVLNDTHLQRPGHHVSLLAVGKPDLCFFTRLLPICESAPSWMFYLLCLIIKIAVSGKVSSPHKYSILRSLTTQIPHQVPLGQISQNFSAKLGKADTGLISGVKVRKR